MDNNKNKNKQYNKNANQNEANDVNVPLIQKKRDIIITNNMTKITKDLASQLAEEIERQPHSHTNYGYWSQSSLDPGAKMVSKTEAKKQKIPIVVNGDNNNDIDGNRNIKCKDKNLWRDLIAYWILGLCNNYGYVVMLSAAHDIIDKFNHKENVNVSSSSESIIIDSGRICHVVSTGTILLADIIPSMIAKTTAPFLPFWVHCRVFTSVALAGAGFLMVAFASSEWMALLGVISTSFSCGLGETTFLAYSTHFDKNVVSTWSSGTGGAGVIGSLSYAALTSLNIGPANTMLIMLIFPAIEAVAFWILLRHPSIKNIDRLSESSSSDEIIDDEKPLITIREKIHYTFGLMKYMLPLTLVYFFEYFINQGLFELVYFENTFLDKAAQYRWLNFDYQVGVFISRSSVNCFTLNKIYLMSIFQFVNVVYFLAEVIFYVTPNLWIVFIIVFWEGLLGGGAYVNTFYRMSKEISSSRRVFAMGIVAQADSYGIALAGFLAIPVHNAICRLPAPQRLYTF